MNVQGPEIVFQLVYQGQQQFVHTHTYAYRNLMVLIKDTVFPDCFGECGGMGRCGTCLVQISGVQPSFKTMDRNEKATLLKNAVKDCRSRLACQILVDEQLQGAVIEIQDDYLQM